MSIPPGAITRLVNPPTTSYTLPSGITLSSFLPTQIPGCRIWLDGKDTSPASMTFTAGTTLSVWKDKSGNAANLTAFNGPVSSGAGVIFNSAASQYCRNASFSFNLASRTVFILCMGTSGSATQGFMVLGQNGTADFGSPNAMVMWSPNSANNNLAMSENFSSALQYQVDIASPATSYILYTDTMSGNVRNIYNLGSTNSITGIPANGSSIVENYTPGTSSEILIGARYAPNITLYLSGTVYEVIIYNTALTTAQRQQVEGYLAWKWGIQGNLDPSNPYVTQRPNPSLTNVPYVSTILGRSLTAKFVPATFNPTSIAAIALWLDGADRSPASMTLSGTTVTTWRDKSGNGNNATGVNSPQVISTGGVSFNAASSQRFGLSTPFQQTNTVYIVATTSPTAGVYLFGRDFPTSAPSIILNFTVPVSAARLEYYDGATRAILAEPATPTYIASYIRTFTTSTNINVVGRYNGSEIFRLAGVPGSESSLAWQFLGSANSSANFYTGTIYELLIYNAALTRSQAQQLEGYLAWKWGAQANLPPTHPFKLFPPPP